MSVRSQLAPGRLILGFLGLAIGIGGVLALREATLSTHGEEVGPRIDLVVSAQTEGGEGSQTLPEMVEAQIDACRLEVNSDVVGGIEELGDGRFHAVLAPSMDETNRKQFKGCIEDWLIDHVQVQVLHLDEPEEGDGLGDGSEDEPDDERERSEEPDGD